MKKILHLATLLAALPLVVALVGPSVAMAGQPDQQLQFDMRIVGADLPLEMGPGEPPFIQLSTFDGRCSVPSTWVTTINSAGTSRALGHVTVTNSHCTTFPFFDNPPQHATFVDGRMTITAANGDELWVHYSGSFDFTPGVNPPAGVSAIHYSSMTVVGGTGRFVDATGHLTGEAIDDWPAGANVATFDGTVTYQASNRADQ